MKKLQFISLFLLCLMIFSSCDGIGDGALTPESGATEITAPPVEITEETKGEETVAIKTEPDLNTERSDFAELGNVIGCAIFRFNLSGEQQERSYPVSDLAQTLYTDLAYGKLDSNAVRKNTISDYITVEFTDSEGTVEKYCVWADNFVMKMRAGNSMTNTPLGTIRGAYAKCEEYVLTYKG
ncbi:MAG: hypothetical protein J6S71_00850 [Clostridia bacterium]|nr:hypothetical protein [Clostridia bacterium]